MKKFIALLMAALLVCGSISSALAYSGKVTATPYLSLRSSDSIDEEKPGSNIKAYIPYGKIVTYKSETTTNGFLYLTSAPSHRKRDFSDECENRSGYGAKSYIQKIN